MGYSPAEVELALGTVAALGPEIAGDGAVADKAVATPALPASPLRQAVAHLAVEVAAVAQPRLRARIAARRIDRDRAKAGPLWLRIDAASQAQRRLLVGRLQAFQTWALCERLAQESQRAASADVATALELAHLAVTAAGLVVGSPAWRNRMAGYAHAYLADALNVSGNRTAAFAEWRTAWRLWRAGVSGDPAGILPERHLLDLYAAMGRSTHKVALAADDGDAAPPHTAGSPGPCPPAAATTPDRGTTDASPHDLPRPWRIALVWLRERIAWTQQDLAAAADAHQSSVSGYERDNRTLTRRRFEALASAAMGYAPAEVDLVLLTISALAPSTAAGGAIPAHPATVTPAEDRIVRQAAAHLAVEVAALAKASLPARAAARSVARARAQTDKLWKVLAGCAPSRRLLLVECLPAFQSWALAERLADESRRAAPNSADTALELAQLAVTVAGLAAGSDAWRSRLQGYARAFLANALRVQGNLIQADAEWQTVWQLWNAGAAGDPTAVLPAWRLVDLEASLRRDARQFAAALDLLDRAALMAPRSAAGRILLNRAYTLELAGDSAAALAALSEAAPLVRQTGDPRLQWVLAFNMGVNLCHLGAFSEAAAQVPILRQLTLVLANELDLLRVGWLQGRVAAGMGNRQEASAAFGEVRDEFAARGNHLASALVSLELAIIYLEDGRLAEVRRLALEMRPVLVAQRIEREALASLRLFCAAAVRQMATIEQARAALRLLSRSHHLGFITP